MSAEKRFVQLVYIILSLPVVIFMLTWIRPVIGISASILIVLALVFAMRNSGSGFIVLPKKTILIAFVIAFVWCFFAGQGGFWYQSGDHAYRNAIFRDLIYHPWPVVFEKHDILLNYYIGYWLVPALFGKIGLIITQNNAVAWLIARIALLLWSTVSITICFLLLSQIVHCKSEKHLILAILFFIMFSGMDIVGIYLRNGKVGLHLEWWAKKYQYSSFTTCLFWVFNQAVPAWIATLLLLADRRIENFAFCGLCIFISSPIPLIGLIPLYLVIGCQELISSKSKSAVLRKAFSLQNIIACLIIFPICLIYYADNSAIQRHPIAVQQEVSQITTTNIVSQQTDIANKSEPDNYTKTLIKMIKDAIWFGIFYILEAGIFLVLLFKKQKRSILFWCLVIELFLIPFIHIGHAADFAMRASIPPLVVLMIMTFNDFFDSYKKKTYKFTLYCVILTLAVMTPGKEFYRGFFEVYKYNQFANNTLPSIENTIDSSTGWNNFISYNYSKSLFYKYLAKNK